MQAHSGQEPQHTRTRTGVQSYCTPTHPMRLFQILLLVAAFAPASRHPTVVSSLSVDVAHSGECNFGGSVRDPIHHSISREFRVPT